MSRQSSVAHTRGQILREFMGRANFMSRDVRLAKHANQRENGRLRETIDGKHGINSQYRHMVIRANLEADAARRELARTKYRRKSLNPREFRRKFNKRDPLELMMLEREEMRRQHIEKLLGRLRTRSERAESRVKDFIVKIEVDIRKQHELELPEIIRIIRQYNQEQLVSRPSSAVGGPDESRETTPEDFAPDGKLRTRLKLPNVEESWEGARRARYIRTRFLREFERELSSKEIFDWNGLPSIAV